MSSFTFGVPETIKNMENGLVMCVMQRKLAMFAIICIDEDGVSSHGGPIVSVVDGDLTESSVNTAINDAVAKAMDANIAAGEEHPCKYIPVTIGLDPSDLFQLTRQLYQLDVVTEVAVEEEHIKSE